MRPSRQRDSVIYLSQNQMTQYLVLLAASQKEIGATFFSKETVRFLFYSLKLFGFADILSEPR